MKGTGKYRTVATERHARSREEFTEDSRVCQNADGIVS